MRTENHRSESGIPRWWHKKYVAILLPEQFRDFTDTQGLFAETVETMGSLGAPGYGFGWAPAISFKSENEVVSQDAYVTPNISEEEEKRLEKIYGKENNQTWQAIKTQVIDEYGIN